MLGSWAVLTSWFCTCRQSQGLSWFFLWYPTRARSLEEGCAQAGQPAVSKEESRPKLLVLCPECKHWGGGLGLINISFQCVFKSTISRLPRNKLTSAWNRRMRLCKANMCAYGLKCPDSGKPLLKPTGLAASHSDVVSRAHECPGHTCHKVIEGRCKDDVNLSSFAAKYTPQFVDTWLSFVLPQPPDHLYFVATVQASEGLATVPAAMKAIPSECLAGEEVSPAQIQQSCGNCIIIWVTPTPLAWSEFWRMLELLRRPLRKQAVSHVRFALSVRDPLHVCRRQPMPL